MNKKVLVIEDNPLSQQLLDDILSYHGYQVSICSSGEEGVQAYVEDSPDITLLDIHLPGINGIEVLKKIRAVQGIDARPVVAVTAGAMLEEKDELSHAGFDEVIYKPIILDHVVATVARLV